MRFTLRFAVGLFLLSGSVFASAAPTADDLERAGYRLLPNRSILRLADRAVAPPQWLPLKAGLEFDREGGLVELTTGLPVEPERLPAALARLFAGENAPEGGEERRSPNLAAIEPLRDAAGRITADASPDKIVRDSQTLWDLKTPLKGPAPVAQVSAPRASPAEIVVVRHGQSVTIVGKPKNGRTSSPLEPPPVARSAAAKTMALVGEDPAPAGAVLAADRAPMPARALRIEREGRAVKIAASKTLSVRFTPLTNRSFRVQALVAGASGPKLPEFMVVTPDESRASVELSIEHKPGSREVLLRTPAMAVSIASTDGKTFVVTAAAGSPEKKIIERWELDPEKRRARLKLREDEHVYGFGDKREAMDQRGHEVEILNHDALFSEDNDGYKSIPFYMSSAGYGLFFHNFFKSKFDVGASDRGWLELKGTGGEMDFYAFLGEDPKEIVSQYTELTGRPAMLPLWFFGYHQGKASYRGLEALEVARQMRERGLPVDAIYYDGWEKEANDPAFVAKLWKEYGIRLTLGFGMPFFGKYGDIDDSALLNDLAKRGFLMTDRQGKPVIGPAEEVSSPHQPNSVGYVDYFNPKAVEYLFKEHFSKALKAGSILGMVDFGELDHLAGADKKFWPSVKGLTVEQTRNIFGLVYPLMLVEWAQKLAGGRMTGMVRPGFAGSQRLGWTTTADSKPTYAQFRAHLKALLNLTLSGFSNVGFDIGGWDAKGSDDVYIRWFAAGAFNPFMWSHGQGDHEPYSHGPEVEKAAKEFLELRYRLIPYLYSLGERAHRTGIPIQRTFPLQEPGDARAHAVDDEFFVGDHLLVAPVMDRDGRKVYLPKGLWYDFFDENKPVAGPVELDRASVAFNRIPAYARAGAVIPMGPAMTRTGEKPVDPLTVHFYSYAPEDLAAGKKTSEFSLYEDDGISTDYKQGHFQRTVLRFEQSREKVRFQVEVASGNGKYRAAQGRRYQVIVHGARGKAESGLLRARDFPWETPNP